MADNKQESKSSLPVNSNPKFQQTQFGNNLPKNQQIPDDLLKISNQNDKSLFNLPQSKNKNQPLENEKQIFLSSGNNFSFKNYFYQKQEKKGFNINQENNFNYNKDTHQLKFTEKPSLIKNSIQQFQYRNKSFNSKFKIPITKSNQPIQTLNISQKTANNQIPDYSISNSSISTNPNQIFSFNLQQVTKTMQNQISLYHKMFQQFKNSKIQQINNSQQMVNNQTNDNRQQFDNISTNQQQKMSCQADIKFMKSKQIDIINENPEIYQQIIPQIISNQPQIAKLDVDFQQINQASYCLQLIKQHQIQSPINDQQNLKLQNNQKQKLETHNIQNTIQNPKVDQNLQSQITLKQFISQFYQGQKIFSFQRIFKQKPQLLNQIRESIDFAFKQTSVQQIRNNIKQLKPIKNQSSKLIKQRHQYRQKLLEQIKTIQQQNTKIKHQNAAIFKRIQKKQFNLRYDKQRVTEYLKLTDLNFRIWTKDFPKPLVSIPDLRCYIEFNIDNQLLGRISIKANNKINMSIFPLYKAQHQSKNKYIKLQQIALLLQIYTTKYFKYNKKLKDIHVLYAISRQFKLLNQLQKQLKRIDLLATISKFQINQDHQLGIVLEFYQFEVQINIDLKRGNWQRHIVINCDRQLKEFITISTQQKPHQDLIELVNLINEYMFK